MCLESAGGCSRTPCKQVIGTAAAMLNRRSSWIFLNLNPRAAKTGGLQVLSMYHQQHDNSEPCMQPRTQMHFQQQPPPVALTLDPTPSATASLVHVPSAKSVSSAWDVVGRCENVKGKHMERHSNSTCKAHVPCGSSAPRPPLR